MNDSIELYESADGHVRLAVRADVDTVWLTQQQLAALFGRDVTVIRRHIANARREELADSPTSAKFALVQQEGQRTVEREVEHYNLDMILSVGYRVKSAEGVRFRRWATQVLKQYLLEGAAINERRLQELGQVVQILARSRDELVAGVADVLSEYLPGLTLLRDYDNGDLAAKPAATPNWVLTIEEARSTITELAREFPEDTMLGRERGETLAGIIETLYQAFAGHELYPTVEEKAANLLYLVVKDHPLADGNKRSAAALFVTFLAKNGILHDTAGAERISNNALAAITLMIAMSDPKEKRILTELVTRMISEEQP